MLDEPSLDQDKEIITSNRLLDVIGLSLKKPELADDIEAQKKDIRKDVYKKLQDYFNDPNEDLNVLVERFEALPVKE